MPAPLYPIPYEEVSSLPTIVLDNPTMVALVTHVATHIMSVTPAAPGVPAHLSLAWYGMSDASWDRLMAVAPQLSYTKRDIHGLKHLLHVLVKDALQSRGQQTQVGAALLLALPGSDVIPTVSLQPSNTTTS